MAPFIESCGLGNWPRAGGSGTIRRALSSGGREVEGDMHALLPCKMRQHHRAKSGTAGQDVHRAIVRSSAGLLVIFSGKQPLHGFPELTAHLQEYLGSDLNVAVLYR